MPVFRLTKQLIFPPPHLAEAGGLLAVGGDLRPDRLILGYRSGIFPWYSEGEPIWWHSPDPRFVLEPQALHLHRSLKKILRRKDYEIRLDTSFEAVIQSCAKTPRNGQHGTWITREMQRSYLQLHEQKLAHSAEAWANGELVGGLYGVAIGGMFFGESMFSLAPDASKCAFAVLVRWMQARGIALIDSQVHTQHLERFGAVHWPREQYLERLVELVDQPGIPGRWALEPGDGALSF